YKEEELKTTVEMALNRYKRDQQQVEKVKQDIISKKKIKININSEINASDDLRAKIMVVEDEAISAIDITNKIEDMGYKVIDKVSSGSKAIENARMLRPDLILMDIMLKGSVDGINVSKSLRDLDIPVVYITAYADEKTLKRAKE